MHKVIRWLLLTLGVIFTAYIVSTSAYGALARADIGGLPGPGLPSYPCVGQVGLVGVVPYYFSDCPTESNGTHMHCEAGGVAISGGAFTASNGVGIGGLGQVGFVFGSCYFKWPDGSLGPAPNPAGAWRNFLVPAPIPIEHTAPPQPYDQTIDVAPPPVVGPPPPPDCDNCPPGPAPIPPQVLPPPTIAPPVMVGPIVPGQTPELLAPPPDKVGPTVTPGTGIVPLSPENKDPIPPNPSSLKPEGQT